MSSEEGKGNGNFDHGWDTDWHGLRGEKRIDGKLAQGALNHQEACNLRLRT